MTNVGRWSPNKVRKRVLENTWPELGATLGGMVLVEPTSVSVTGPGATATYASSVGSVSFTGCEGLSINGVFTSAYNNYMVIFRATSNSSSTASMRLRANGTDSIASSYTFQQLRANSTTVSSSRTIDTTYTNSLVSYSTERIGSTISLYGPFLAQPTALRTVSAGDNGGAEIEDYAATHAVSSSYDGFSIYGGLSTYWTGLVSVYGLVGA